MEKNDIYVIAEMACSHDGNPDWARKIIDGAGLAGADAIQLQIWSLEYMMAPSHPKYDLCKKIELSREDWASIVEYSRKRYPKMDIYSFVYEHKSIDFVKSLGIDGYKLSSSDLSNPLVLERVAATGKKVNLSIGASTMDEIASGIQRVRQGSDAEITLMYGYQSFPTLIKDINLRQIGKIKEIFNLPMGYQDHCDADHPSSFWIPALAVGMGVNVIEKHITHDRSLKGVDYESALNPDEFKNFVCMMRELESAHGEGELKEFSPEEIKYREFQKKSVVASRDIKAGETIKKEDVSFLRASELGFAPDQVAEVVDRAVICDIKAFQVIRKEYLT